MTKYRQGRDRFGHITTEISIDSTNVTGKHHFGRLYNKFLIN